jgi:hypothetical protein
MPQWTLPTGIHGTLARLAEVMALLDATVSTLPTGMLPADVTLTQAQGEIARTALQTIYDTLRQRVAA